MKYVLMFAIIGMVLIGIDFVVGLTTHTAPPNSRVGSSIVISFFVTCAVFMGDVIEVLDDLKESILSKNQ